MNIGLIKPSSTACLVDSMETALPALTITTLIGPLVLANLSNCSGQIISLFVLTVAAAEAAIGLAILVIYNRNAGTIEIEKINSLKG